jgi:MFS family permease
VPLGGWLIARHGRPLGFSAVGALGAVVSLGAVYAGSEPAIWLLLGGLLWGAPAGPLSAAPAQFLSPGARAIGLGLFYTMFYVGMAVLPRATGALADATGSPDTVLLVAIGMTLASLALMVATQAAIAGRKAPQRPATRP